MEVGGQLHDPAALPPGEEPPGTHWIAGWVGPRAPAGNPAVQPVAGHYSDWAIYNEVSRKKMIK
jgi:hypothetical protein